MHFLSYTPQRERFLFLLWALLFAKCFIVEHFVQAYAVPVNSWLYVWGLSISMASVASVVFLRVRGSEHRTHNWPRGLLWGWLSFSVVALSLVLVAWLTPWFGLGGLTAGLALALGGAYAWQGLHSKTVLDWLPAAGWGLVAVLHWALAPAFYLLTFGFGLLAFVVAPLAVKLILDWYQGRAAVRALSMANHI
jgi:hypothetical protein